MVAGDAVYVGTDNARPIYPAFHDEAGVLMAFRAEAIWGCLRLGGDWLYVGNVEGRVTVLRAGRQKELLAQVEMDAPLYSPPALIGDAFYLVTANRLYLITARP